MAVLKTDTEKIIANIKSISKFLKENGKEWSLITKVFSGDKDLLERILKPEVLKDIHSVGDSRLSSLKRLKSIRPDLKNHLHKTTSNSLCRGDCKICRYFVKQFFQNNNGLE